MELFLREHLLTGEPTYRGLRLWDSGLPSVWRRVFDITLLGATLRCSDTFKRRIRLFEDVLR